MVNYVQLVRAKSLNNDPRNSRAIVRDFDRPRGQIITADKAVLACTVETSTDPKDDPQPLTSPAGQPAPDLDCARKAQKVGSFDFQRLYPERDLFGHVTGYLNLNFGATGIERQYNAELAGRTTSQQLHSLSDLFVDRTHTGDVVLTIRKDVQEVARQALGDQRGSVVALDPRDGSILALWSFPSYDPNALSTHDGPAAAAAKRFLEANPDKPLRARTYQERFFPGSTFKVVTGSVGVDIGKVTPQEPVFPVATEYDPPDGRPIHNFGGESCGGALFEILAVSCNSAFAQMGAEVNGQPAMLSGAERFGFNHRPPIDLPAAAVSAFPDTGRSKAFLAQASIGQNSVQATPLQMAMVAGTIANNGVLMVPHLLSQVRNEQGDVISRSKPQVWQQSVSGTTAATMRQAMEGVVANGTATRLQIPGVEVGGKTGTAQVNPTDPNAGVEAWIVAFAGPPGGTPTVAVCVLVEAQQGFSDATGGRVAAPIAKQVIQKVLEVQG
jgi:peptidoglycan glycosyltransferase